MKWTLPALSLLTLLAIAPLASAQEKVVEAVTAPSQRLELAMPQVAVVREVPVKEGQAVRPGDLLIQQDDAAEVARLHGLELRADVEIAVRARETDLALKKIRYERTKSIVAGGGGNESELQEAETEMKLAEIAVERERHEGKVAGSDALVQAERIRQMKLLSPVTGFVERIESRVGESTDPQRPSVIIVQTNPLNVEIKSLTSQQVRALKLGQEVQVRYADEDTWYPATVKFISPTVDPRSDTQLVKLDLPNPDGRYAGLKVQVRLPAGALAGGGAATPQAGVR